MSLGSPQEPSMMSYLRLNTMLAMAHKTFFLETYQFYFVEKLLCNGYFEKMYGVLNKCIWLFAVIKMLVSI